MQSIYTKYLPPTNFRGARIKATATGGCTATISWDYALELAANHRLAAEKLASSLKWRGRWVGGASKDDDGYVYVHVSACWSNNEFTVALADA